jgi:DNA-directed RNA polymerase sigma subunit (sigma70/sigma32)
MPKHKRGTEPLVTLREAGRIMGVNHQRAHQLEKAALDKLFAGLAQYLDIEYVPLRKKRPRGRTRS